MGRAQPGRHRHRDACRPARVAHHPRSPGPGGETGDGLRWSGFPNRTPPSSNNLRKLQLCRLLQRGFFERLPQSKRRHGEREAVNIQRGNIDEIDTNGSELLAVVLKPGTGQRQSGEAPPTSGACEDYSSVWAGKADNFVDV